MPRVLIVPNNYLVPLSSNNFIHRFVYKLILAYTIVYHNVFYKYLNITVSNRSQSLLSGANNERLERLCSLAAPSSQDIMFILRSNCGRQHLSALNVVHRQVISPVSLITLTSFKIWCFFSLRPFTIKNAVIIIFIYRFLTALRSRQSTLLYRQTRPWLNLPGSLCHLMAGDSLAIKFINLKNNVTYCRRDFHGITATVLPSAILANKIS